ncbi:MAG: nucleotidyl transferase AbiEii/AbiGii toxin family protein [Lachnospiraceae bacterium]|nr:nucleotidyl transferase AbiEii/AbiGii toxin family protein [Lachnospiraceae bacterium]
MERFSEDIDLSMSRSLTASERKRASKAIQSIAERAGLVLLNPDDIFSRYFYNKYVFSSDSLFNGSPIEIIVENNFYLPVYPVSRHTVHSFVGQFCDQRGICYCPGTVQTSSALSNECLRNQAVRVL